MTETLSAGYTEKAAVMQTVARMNVRCEGASGVLAVNAAASVRVSEVISGEVRLAGREYAEVTVAAEDGVRKASGTAEISDRAEIPGITPDVRAFALCRVTDTDIVSVGGGNITLASVIEITVMVERAAVLPPSPEPEDGIFTDSESVRFSRLTARVTGRAESGESERLNIVEVLCCNAGLAPEAPETALDAIYASGRFILDGVGKTAEGLLTPFTVELPYNTEIAAEGVRRGDRAFMRTGPVTVTENYGENGLTLRAGAELDLDVYCEVSAGIVTDAFSPVKELELGRAEVCGALAGDPVTFEEKAEGSAILAEGDNADKITAVCGFRATALSAYAENGKVVLEGAAGGWVIYSDAEAGRRSSVNAELPFRFVTDIDAEDGCEPQADVRVCSVSARPARRGEISLVCALSFTVMPVARVCVRPVTGVSVSGEKEDRTGTLSMHCASEGETLWECAKALSVPPDAVLAQNPELSFPLSKGDKVFVFRSRISRAP